MDTWIIFAAIGVVLGGIFVYVMFMIFLPEWVGITGKTALNAERSHHSGEVAKDNDLLSRLQEPSSKINLSTDKK